MRRVLLAAGLAVFAISAGAGVVNGGLSVATAQVAHDVGVAYQAKFDTPVTNEMLTSIVKTREFSEAAALFDGRSVLYEKCKAKTPSEIAKLCPEVGASEKRYMTLVTKQLIAKMSVGKN